MNYRFRSNIPKSKKNKLYAGGRSNQALKKMSWYSLYNIYSTQPAFFFYLDDRKPMRFK